MRRLSLLLILFLVSLGAFAEPIKTLEFHDQDVQDILLTFGSLNKISIVPDETVTGRASYVFANMEFDQALKTFLAAFQLVAVVKDGVYYISKVSVTTEADGSVDVAAYDAPIKSVIRMLSVRLGKTILYDSLPQEPITVTAQKMNVEELLGILVAKYPDYHVEIKDKFDYIRFQPKAQAAGPGTPAGSESDLTLVGDSFAWNVTEGRFKDLLLKFFDKAGKQVVVLVDQDQAVENLKLKGLNFNDALKALLLQGNADYSVSGDTYTIFTVQRRDLMKKYLTTVILPFEHIASTDFVRLLPPSLNSGSVFKIDDKTNKLILLGSREEIQPVWEFFKLVDQVDRGASTIRVDLAYLKSDEFLPMLGQDFQALGPVALPSKTGFLITLPEGKRAQLETIRQLADRPPGVTPIHLKYLKADDLFAKLPPSITEANLTKTNDPTLVFFKGSEMVLKAFRKDLESIDQPRPLLRYEILVLQYDDGKGLNASTNMHLQTGGDNQNAFTGQMGNLLGFNFDIVGNFGVGFGMSLSASLSDNNAKVIADTTLNGISGEKVTFQNTNTYRYTDNQVDPTTGKPYATGVVRELSSGLILSLLGWISADDMITLQVDATLSKQGNTAATASSGTAPPSTSEKKVTTLVRTASGKPLVIGGLKQEDQSISISKTPILGDIPLLGLLFQQRNESVTRSEFSLYIVPILDQTEWTNLSDEDKALDLYQRFHPGTP
jgi:type II secretory pathway component GspD/PulD (secretin)